MSTDIMYYNLTIRGTNTGVGEVPATILAQNSYPILQNPSEYYGSIIRMSVNLFSIPVAFFYPFVDSNGNVPDVNKGAIAFTLVYGTNSVTQNLTYISNNGETPPNNGLPYKANPYWFIYDYESYINIWNTALLTAYNSLSSLVGLGILPANHQPFFYYNPQSSLIELYCEQTVSEPKIGNYLQIFANDNIQPYIKGFKYAYMNDPSPFKFIMFQVQSLPNTTTPLNNVTLGSLTYIKMSQEFNGMAFWNIVEGVNVLTNLKTIQEGYYVGNGAASSSISQLSNNLIFQSSLTDFLPDLSIGSGSTGAICGIYVYNASSLFRLFQFVNDESPLLEVSATIVWTDKQGNVWPLNIFSNQVCTLKFMFIKKSLINGKLNSSNNSFIQGFRNI